MSDLNKAIIGILLLLVYWAWNGADFVRAASTLIPELTAPTGTYSSTDIVTIIAAVGILFGTLTTSVVTIIGVLRNGQKTDALTVAMVGNEQSTGMKEQLTQIHTATNSSLTAANAKIDNQSEQLRLMAEMIRELKDERQRQDIATATAIVPPTVPAAAPTLPPIINVIAETVTAKTVEAEVLKTGKVEEKK